MGGGGGGGESRLDYQLLFRERERKRWKLSLGGEV